MEARKIDVALAVPKSDGPIWVIRWNADEPGGRAWVSEGLGRTALLAWDARWIKVEAKRELHVSDVS